MKILNRISYIALLALMVSCYSDNTIDADIDIENMDQISIRSEIDQLYQTRVNDMGFVDGDMIGLSVVNYIDAETPGEFLASGNHVDNLKFTYIEETNTWSGEKTIYWKDSSTSADFYSYYPYSEEFTSASYYPFQISRNQSTEAENGNLGGYEASDFLWAKAEGISPTSGAVTLMHSHAMATIQVTLVEGDDFEPGIWSELTKSVVVLNTMRNTTIDLATGEVTAISGEGDDSGIIPYSIDNAFRAIVAPQSIAASTILFTITVDGQSYEFARDEEMIYYPGKMHNFTIQVDSKTEYGDYSFSLVAESISAWENDSVSHDGEAKEYLIVESPTRGGLESVFNELGINPKDISNLKISGEMNGDDFYYIRDNVTYLEAVNLKEVLLRDCYDRWAGDKLEDDVIPYSAFANLNYLTSVVFPDQLKKIGSASFAGCPLKGSLTIPEGVTHIAMDPYGSAAFNCTYLDGTLTLPSTLECIEGDDDNNIWSIGVFNSGSFTSGLTLPEGLTYIGECTFKDCENITGTLKLPSSLTEIRSGTFWGMSGLSGHLDIPDNVRTIGDYAFADTGFTSVSIPENVHTIGECAFAESELKGELILPDNITFIDANAFSTTNITKIKLPENLEIMGEACFRKCTQLQDTITIPSNVKTLKIWTFYGCEKLEAVILPAGLESIEDLAFSGCYSLNYIQCLGETPPVFNYTYGWDAFSGVAKDDFTVVVPEGAVEAYKAADGWSEFKRISAYKDFVCRPMIADVLNAGATREIILNATESWSVTSIPDWCSISQTTGTSKTELTVTIDALASGSSMRSGEIIFTLNDNTDYTVTYTVTQYDYEYEEDEQLTLQAATKGDGIDIFIVGDGYNAADIAAGTYLDDMKQSAEYFFDIEPYKTYKEYFNVYTAFALSYESGIGTVNTIRDVKFSTIYGVSDDGRIGSDDDAVIDYTLANSPITESNLNEALTIVIPNTTIYDGVCVMWTDGTAIAYCPKSESDYPYDARGLVQHEAGGHGFGKLGDEYIYHSAYIQLCTCSCCSHVDELQGALDLGWHRNLSLTGTYGNNEWRHLIFDDRYSDIVDIYSGGYFHSAGVYRSEYNSCMNNNVPYYSTISRQAMVERIMELSGGTFDFETFVANDSREYGQDFTQTRSGTTDVDYPVTKHLHAPIIKQGSPLNR